eukprot:5837-Eustigmatos_ZCMA.PRE.1
MHAFRRCHPPPRQSPPSFSRAALYFVLVAGVRMHAPASLRTHPVATRRTYAASNPLLTR